MDPEVYKKFIKFIEKRNGLIETPIEKLAKISENELIKKLKNNETLDQRLLGSKKVERLEMKELHRKILSNRIKIPKNEKNYVKSPAFLKHLILIRKTYNYNEKRAIYYYEYIKKEEKAIELLVKGKTLEKSLYATKILEELGRQDLSKRILEEIVENADKFTSLPYTMALCAKKIGIEEKAEQIINKSKVLDIRKLLYSDNIIRPGNRYEPIIDKFYHYCESLGVEPKLIKIMFPDIYRIEYFFNNNNNNEINKKINIDEYDNTILLLEFLNSIEKAKINKDKIDKIINANPPESIKKALLYKSLNEDITLEEVLEFEEFNLENKDYFIYKKLGEGFSSKVYLAKYVEHLGDINNVNFNIKIFYPIDKAKRKEHITYYGEKQYFSRAADIQHKLNNLGLNFVPKFYKFGQLTNGNYYTIQEFIRGKNLLEVSNEILNRYKSAHIFDAIAILYEMEKFDILIENIKKLHFKGNIIHRDIKLENIIFNEYLDTFYDKNENQLIYILDWHTAKELQSNGINLRRGAIIDQIRGSAFYTPPEKFTMGESSSATDMYSIGICIYKFFTGKYPFFNNNEPVEEIKEFIKNKNEYKKRLDKSINDFIDLYYSKRVVELKINPMDLYYNKSNIWTKELRIKNEDNIRLYSESNFHERTLAYLTGFIAHTINDLLSYEPEFRVYDSNTYKKIKNIWNNWPPSLIISD